MLPYYPHASPRVPQKSSMASLHYQFEKDHSCTKFFVLLFFCHSSEITTLATVIFSPSFLQYYPPFQILSCAQIALCNPGATETTFTETTTTVEQFNKRLEALNTFTRVFLFIFKNLSLCHAQDFIKQL